MYAEITVRGTKSAKPLKRNHEASSKKTPVIKTSVGKTSARKSGEMAPRLAKVPKSKAADALVGPADKFADPVKIGTTNAATPQPTNPHHTGRPAFIAKAIDIGNARRATLIPARKSAFKLD